MIWHKRVKQTEVNVRTLYRYKEESLPFTGNGFAGGKGVDCITPEYEFAKTASNDKGLYDLMDGAELYKVTQDGDEILLAIYRENAVHPDGKRGRFVRLEDMT